MTELKRHLDSMFPTVENQKFYRVEHYRKAVYKLFLCCCLFPIGSTTSWCIIPIIFRIFKCVTDKSPSERIMPFYAYYFYDTESNIFVYGLTYFMEACCGYFSGVIYFGVDMIICATVIQICMHFDYISRRLEEYEALGNSSDTEFLLPLLNLHKKCLA